MGSFLDRLKKRNASNPTGLQVLYHGGDAAVVDIIFVHGLTGGALRSWSADPSKPSWIEALLPEQVPNARILTFGYHADVIGSRVRALTIRNHASALLHDIEQEIQSQPNRRRRPLIFICHSFGGLVLQKSLILANEDANTEMKGIFQRTYAIVFFGTPMRGSKSAEFGDFLVSVCSIAAPTNRSLIELCRAGSEELYQIKQSFTKLTEVRNPKGPDPLQILCYFESMHYNRTVGLIVNEESATLDGSLYPRRHMDANHVDMVRFTSADDPGFRALVVRLQTWIRELSVMGITHNGPSAEAYFLRGTANLKEFSPLRTGSAVLYDAIFDFSEAARLAESAKPRDSAMYARSHLAISRCQRELSFRQVSWDERRKNLGKARTHLHRAYTEAYKMKSAPFVLRVQVELAVIGARQVMVDEEEGNVRGVVEEREETLKELGRVIKLCEEGGREDLKDWVGKWVRKLGGEVGWC